MNAPRLTLLAGLLALSAPQAGRAADLDKLHVLIAVDTEDPNIGRDCVKDRDNFKKLLAEGIPASRYEVTVLEGKQMTRDNVLGHFRRLKVGGQHGLVFLFSGHGAVNRGDGEHYMQMQGSERLLARKDVREAMVKTGAGLAVLLTEAGANLIDLKPAPAPRPKDRISVRGLKVPDGPGSNRPATDPIKPGYRQLFFAARGVADINGAMTGTSDWSDPEGGSIFVRGLLQTLIDKRDDSDLTWPAVYADLIEKTRATFADWKKKTLEEVRRGALEVGREEREALEKQADQTPQAFLLPDCKVGLIVEGQGGKGVRVLSVLLDGPAHRAGLKPGDVITRMDGRDVREVKDYDAALDQALERPGAEVKLGVAGPDGKARELKMSLAPR